MKIYKSKSETTEEIDMIDQFNTIVKIGSSDHWRTRMEFTPDYVHDSLHRCTDCGIKYDIHSLRRIDLGVFLCKFCAKGVA